MLLRYGGSVALTRVLCGGFALAEQLLSSTLAAVPDIVRIDHRDATATWLEPILAIKFREHTGEPAMRYLTKLRLNKAAGYLSTGQPSIHEIARLTGYGSEATL